MIPVSKQIRHKGVWLRADKLIWKACGKDSGSFFFAFFFSQDDRFLDFSSLFAYLIGDHASGRQRQQRCSVRKYLIREGKINTLALRFLDWSYLHNRLFKLQFILNSPVLGYIPTKKSCAKSKTINMDFFTMEQGKQIK